MHENLSTFVHHVSYFKTFGLNLPKKQSLIKGSHGDIDPWHKHYFFSTCPVFSCVFCLGVSGSGFVGGFTMLFNSMVKTSVE